MKTILTDCDGVLLWWEDTFHEWMQARNYNTKETGLYIIEDMYDVSKKRAEQLVREFCNSAWIGFLPEFRDARSGVARLVEHGYDFICITSVSKDPYTKILRQMNLDNVFGKGVVKELICLDTGEDKDSVLLPYKDSGMWWIEDSWKNAVKGADLGLKSIIIDHKYNQNEDSRITRVQTWKEIADIIIDERIA